MLDSKILTTILLALMVLLTPSDAATANTKRNIIMMVTDGTGPAAINMARSYQQYINQNETSLLTLDDYLVGTSRTKSSSSLITDSAAGATAFSCALKSYNGAIGVDPHQNSCYTILEALKHKGYKTGLVVTTSITDATPAAFNAHVNYRTMQSEIALQQLGLNSAFGPVTDLMIGGGRCFYLPGSHIDGCRNDDLNLIDYAKDNGWNIATNRDQFDSWKLGGNVSLPILALHSFYNVPYEIDRNPKDHPSIYEQTQLALNVLSDATSDSEEGFFLMIEGSRIDHAGHHNDAHAQVREVLAYDKAFKAVIDFIDSSDTETIMLATSDHETGGLTIGRQVGRDYPDYAWYPEILDNANASGEQINSDLVSFIKSSQHIDREMMSNYVSETIFSKQLGIKDYRCDELRDTLDLIHRGNITDAVEYFKNMVNERALIGWTTHGHTAVDVNIYAHSNTKGGDQLIWDNIRGGHENIEIGLLLAKLGGVTDIGRELDYKFKPRGKEMFKIPSADQQRIMGMEMEMEMEMDAAIHDEVEIVEEMEHGFMVHQKDEPLEKEL